MTAQGTNEQPSPRRRRNIQPLEALEGIVFSTFLSIYRRIPYVFIYCCAQIWARLITGIASTFTNLKSNLRDLASRPKQYLMFILGAMAAISIASPTHILLYGLFDAFYWKLRLAAAQPEKPIGFSHSIVSLIDQAGNLPGKNYYMTFKTGFTAAVLWPLLHLNIIPLLTLIAHDTHFMSECSSNKLFCVHLLSTLIHKTLFRIPTALILAMPAITFYHNPAQFFEGIVEELNFEKAIGGIPMNSSHA